MGLAPSPTGSKKPLVVDDIDAFGRYVAGAVAAAAKPRRTFHCTTE
jgi:hypothetical protein